MSDSRLRTVEVRAFFVEAVSAFQAATVDPLERYFVTYVVADPKEHGPSTPVTKLLGKWVVTPRKRPSPWTFAAAWLSFKEQCPMFGGPEAKLLFTRLWYALQEDK